MKQNNLGKFKPSQKLLTLWKRYLMLFLLLFVLPWYIPFLLFGPFMASIAVTLAVLVLVAVLLWYFPKEYDAINYHLDKDEITWRRGVWFKKTGVVPYNRVTNVDVEQGPISRKLGIASLKLQTAGYSGNTAATAEMRISGVENAENMRELLMKFIKGKKGVAVECDEGDDPALKELIKIRKLLEKK